MKKQIALLVFCLFASVSTAFAQCNACTLNGSTAPMIAGQTRTFSTPAFFGYSYFWTTTGGLSIVGSNTGTSVSIKANSGTSGTVNVVRYKTGTVPCSASKSISITSNCNFTSVSVTRVSGDCSTGIYTFRATPNVFGVPMTFTWRGGFGSPFILSGQGTNQVTVVTSPNTAVGIEVSVTACNTTKIGYAGYLCEDPCGGVICPTVPNSGSLEQGQDIVIALNRQNNELYQKLDQTVTVEVVDKFGTTLKTSSTLGDELRIPTNDLQSGVYILSITGADGEKHIQRVAIK